LRELIAEFLTQAVDHHWPALRQNLSQLDTQLLLSFLYHIFEECLITIGEVLNVQESILISTKHNQLCEQLLQKKFIKAINEPDVLMGWFERSIQEFHSHSCDNATLPFFEAQIIQLRSCKTQEEAHYQLTSLPKTQTIHYLQLKHYQMANGNLQSWLYSQVLPSSDHIDACWKSCQGEQICKSTPSIMEIWIHIPIMLVLSLDYESLTETWCLPKKLKLFQNSNHLEGLHYNLVGKAIYSPSVQHFTSRFHNGNAIYEHDGLQHSGSSVKIQKGTISQYLEKKIQIVPGISSYTSAVILYMCCKVELKLRKSFRKYKKKSWLITIFL
jgi:hypothetical protein